MNILITGGSGFIGSNFTNHHLNKGDRVSVIDNLSSGQNKNITRFQGNPNFHFYEANILNCPQLEEMVGWADRIYHLAAIVGIFRVLSEPLSLMQVNVKGTDCLLQAVANSKSRPHIVFASSSSVYGPGHNRAMNENDDLIVESSASPLQLYAISKLTGEALTKAYHQTYQIPMTIIRLFNVIGPHQTGQYGMVVPRFIKQACSNEPITVFGDGNQTRSFCDIRDVLSAIDLLNLSDKNGFNVINIGNDSEIKINDLAKLVISRTNSKSKIEHIPYREAYGMEYFDIAKRKPDISKLRELTGFEHQWTLQKTIDDLIDLYKRTGDI